MELDTAITPPPLFTSRVARPGTDVTVRLPLDTSPAAGGAVDADGLQTTSG